MTAPIMAKEVHKQVNYLREKGITILLCEQNASVSLNLSNRAYILEKGQMSWRGYFADLKRKPEITNQYLSI